ncbi:hypothetical protein Tco_1347402 [Tanacetum coccineum]
MGRKENCYGSTQSNTKLPKPDVKVKEKIVKAEVVEDHIEKIQDLKSYKQHDDKISTLLFETTNTVGTLKTCKEIMGSNDDEDMKGFNCELKTEFECVHNLNVRDLDYGLISKMIIKNKIKFSMANKDAIFITIDKLRVADKEYTTRCFGSWVDRWEYGRHVKNYKGFRVDVKRKSIEDKVLRKKMFEVDEALDIKNSRAISFQVRGIHVDVTKVNAVRDWSSTKTLPEELYANDEDFGNTGMELETKQHRDCDDESRPEEQQHLVVPCSDEEIVKFPTQLATTEIKGEDGSNLEEFSNVLTVEEADITRPIMEVQDEPLMMLGSGPNIIKEDFSNDLDG